DFDQIVVAIKSSDVPTMIAANEVLADSCDYPIHLGVTEAGTSSRGIVKSAVGIGSLLTRGIGDTIRVSLTSDPVNEVIAAKRILEYAGVRENDGIDVVSCPTCGRTKIDLISMCDEFDRRSATEIKINKKIKVAIMGCAVNGPGEAREADIGIAGGNGEALLFKKGEIISKIPEEKAIDVLIEEINKM
ncbi:MAG: flavodoxin-dependent (E)-4-hydroxy-3-methylbut-2-enyl-diphosphate synthase, partial [Clostridia bacterium]|nr:flavodoxin-dependent (E)-4-hydroxy-3-methylbut-2-enyl-diphosphate synthase [Clostridia bacterium]